MEENLRYPIGQYKIAEVYNLEVYNEIISQIKSLPERLKSEVSQLRDFQLDTPYRPGGWTIRQVVHHLADSHMNSFIRLKLSLTEENPIIKPYNPSDWGELDDVRTHEISSSIHILHGLHKRWVSLLKSFKDSDWDRSFLHPEQDRLITLKESMGMYAWHGNHHLAHITTLKFKERWK